MKKKFKLGVIGAGFMASAIVKGIVESKTVEPCDIIVSDISADSLQKISSYGVNTTLNSEEVSDNSQFVIIAVKPQSFSAVAEVIKNASCKNYISIMAGVKKQRIKDLLGNVNVARCMPNTPCSIGFGAVGLDVSDYTLEEDKKFISSLFSSVAKVSVVAESDLNTVTGISGSSPAYYYLFVKSVIEAGVKNGLDYEVAKNLAVSTMIGAGKMILNNPDKSIDELIASVCSKGGTTIEAVNVFKNKDLSGITQDAVDMCIKRASELENL